MRRLISLLLVLALVAGLPAAAMAEGEQEHEFHSEDYPLYLMSTDNKFTQNQLLFFFDGVDDLPWIDLEELADILTAIQNQIYENSNYLLTYEKDGSLVTLTRENGYTMKVDLDADTIYFVDYNGFIGMDGDKTLQDLLSYSGFNADGEAELFQRDPKQSFDRYGDEITLNLADYDIHLIDLDDRGYIPLQTANDLVIAPMFKAFMVFNGKAVILGKDSHIFDFDTKEFSDLGDLYYSVEPAQRSQALCEFGYNELCLMLDSMYGLKEKHDIRSFKHLFWQIGYDADLTSPDPKTADNALRNFISYYLDDLHSGYSLPSWMTGLQDMEGKKAPSARFYDEQEDQYAKLRRAGMGDDIPAYQEVGNTAYITFDEFDDSGVSYYDVVAQGDTLTGTIGLVIYANQQIKREDSPIENVVIDLTNNGGGDADAALFLISWILGEAEISVTDSFTGAQSTMVYRADTNLDRAFDESDTLAGKNVYCLISPNSFSCGNLVPSVCKAHQAVTLIGRTSGGGACVVQPMCSAWGTMFQISGTRRLSFRKNGSFYDIDEGVAPDVYIDRLELLYDREALTDMINGLN